MNNYNNFWNMEVNPYSYFNEMRMYPEAVDNMYMNKEEMNNNLYDAYEGYMKGNMFKNLYDPYMNYKSEQIMPRDEREELLLNLNKIQFCMHELSLVLDIDPNNRSVLNGFNKYKTEYDKLLKEYESKYEIINIEGNSHNDTSYGWEKGRWPWEGGIL